MRRLPVLIPHRPGCADFPLPVLHGRASLVVVYRWTIRGAGRGRWWCWSGIGWCRLNRHQAATAASARVAVLGRDEPHHILAGPRLAPDVGKAEEGERGPIRGRVGHPI